MKSKKDEKPPWWDKPLAALMIIAFVAVLVLFIMQYAGPAAIMP